MALSIDLDYDRSRGNWNRTWLVHNLLENAQGKLEI